MYDKGEGTPQDYKMAYAWFSVASANSLTDATELSDAAASKLTASALGEAQELAKIYFKAGNAHN